jgi:hypothetical protein
MAGTKWSGYDWGGHVLMDDLWTPWRGYWDPVSVDSEIRDVFAYYGLVAYYLQVLEVNVVQYLVGQRLRDSQRSPPTDLGDFFDHGRTKTLGQLLRMLDSQATGLPVDIRRNLDDALRRRNYLTHHFFWDAAHDFLGPEGRKAMIDRLTAEREWLIGVNNQLTRLTLAMLEPRGITPEQIEAVIASMAREAEL